MRRDQPYLLDILESARLAVSYLNGVEKDAFLQDTQLQDSVIRRIEIIVEAARRISETTREALSELSWSEMIGMRNLMIHAYDSVDLEIVWDTVQKELPPLIAALERLVPTED